MMTSATGVRFGRRRMITSAMETLMVATWSARYLDRDRLRREVQCLAECFVEALLDSIPRPEVRGVYLKG